MEKEGGFQLVTTWICCYRSVSKSHPTLRPHGLQHTRLLHYIPEFAQTHVHWAADSTQLSHPLLSPSPPALNPSQHQVFSNELALHIRWPKDWSFSFSISPSNEYSELISFRIDCFDLLAVQGTLKSILQHHSSKASVFQRSAFFMVPLSHPYVTTGKTIVLTIETFVGRMMSLFFNKLSRFVIAFLPRSKHLLILWLQLLSAVILEPKKIKSATVSTFSPSIWHEMMEPDAIILVFWMLRFMPAFSLSSFTLIKRLFSCCSLSATRVVSAYLSLLVFLQTILILPCDSSSPAFHMKNWCWKSNTLANWCEELTPWKRLWWWERLKAGGEGDNREWDIGWHHHEFE